MKPDALPHFVLLAGFALCSSCGWLKPDTSAARQVTETPQARQELIGRISSISPDGSFVLIQRYPSFNATIDSVLTVHGEGQRSANLIFTGESLGAYAAADIQSGMPQVGDPVFLPAPPKAPAPPEPVVEP